MKKNNRRISIGLILVSVFLSIHCFSQPQAPSGFSSDKIFFGGNIGGIGISSYGTAIDVAPIVGYRVTPELAVGTGIVYQYFSSGGISASNIGGKVFTRYIIWKGLFAHTEYELLNRKIILVDNNNYVVGTFRKWVGSMFIGGGVQQQLGSNSVISVMALYNLNQTQYSPRDPLYLSVGFGFGF